jgi:hypothetical protein
MVAAELLLLAAAAHVQRMQMSDVAHQMRQRRRRLLLMDLAFHWQTPLTSQTRRKVERSPNGWMSSTMYGYVFGKDGVRNSDDVFRANFRMGAGTFDLLCERLRGNAAYKFAHDSYVRRESGEKIRGKKPVRRWGWCLHEPVPQSVNSGGVPLQLLPFIHTLLCRRDIWPVEKPVQVSYQAVRHEAQTHYANDLCEHDSPQLHYRQRQSGSGFF